MNVTDFQHLVRSYYQDNARTLPWRTPESNGRYDPYKILVSEVMLQQTQVSRVIEKYNLFISTFPTLQSLSEADLKDILIVWSGLGYNRRAKYLHEAAKTLVLNSFPQNIDELVALKGVGKNTASAILVYAFDMPQLFIETNIRTVIIHHLFTSRLSISDEDIMKKLQKTLPKDNFREWYWALMDYGAYLKSTGVKSARRSTTYTKQSVFEGSTRQLRGKVIQALTSVNGNINATKLQKICNDNRFPAIIDLLEKENIVKVYDDHISLA